MNATTDPAGMFGVALLAVSTAIVLSAWRCALVAIGNSVLVTITMARARHSSLVFILHPVQQMGAGEPDAAMLDVAARSTSTASMAFALPVRHQPGRSGLRSRASPPAIWPAVRPSSVGRVIVATFMQVG